MIYRQKKLHVLIEIQFRKQTQAALLVWAIAARCLYFYFLGQLWRDILFVQNILIFPNTLFLIHVYDEWYFMGQKIISISTDE